MPDPKTVTFLIVTPAFNAPEFLDETIDSVVSQRGDFTVRYHIQDGGSTDSTLSILDAWASHLAAPLKAKGNGVRFSWKSEPDRSMYDGIQKGFDELLRRQGNDPDELVVMTWINSDDRFTPNAFQTVAKFLSDNPEEQWITGLPCLVREDGCIADTRLENFGYARARLAKGQHDGRTLPFVMQEGTFWTRDLWEAVGGLNVDLRLAGDWDLWRRMAQFSRLITFRAVLAYHRRRPGQLSDDMTRYWEELDRCELAVSGQEKQATETAHAIALDGAWTASWRMKLEKWAISPSRYRREGFLHCLSDCLVESWTHYAWGRAVIRLYRRLRGVEVDT
jgi:glycosyltransferase involved in cell wall biosynthesis